MFAKIMLNLGNNQSSEVNTGRVKQDLAVKYFMKNDDITYKTL